MEIISKEKNQAIQLRKQGKTYGEISKKIQVSKSTLSGWLRDVKVPARFISRIQQKKLEAVSLGWAARRKQRIDRTELIVSLAQKEVKRLMLKPLWLVGLTLYWAEGHKEKQWRSGVLVTFTNMDEDTVILFMDWCRTFLEVRNEDFVCSLYIHDSRKTDTHQMRKWWAERLSMSSEAITVYYKKAAKTHVRHNDNDGYHGVLRVRVRRSVDMNRRIAAWTSEMVRSLKNENELA